MNQLEAKEKFRNYIVDELGKFPAEKYPEANRYLSQVLYKIDNEGLIAIHYYKNEDFKDDGDIEAAYAELNRMMDAPSLPDDELFSNGLKFF